MFAQSHAPLEAAGPRHASRLLQTLRAISLVHCGPMRVAVLVRAVRSPIGAGAETFPCLL